MPGALERAQPDGPARGRVRRPRAGAGRRAAPARRPRRRGPPPPGRAGGRRGLSCEGGREAELRGPAEDLVGQGERGQAGRDAVEHRGAALLGRLERLPVPLDLVGVGDVEPCEDVRVPAHELVDDVASHVVDGEALGILGGDAGVEVHLQQQVAELLAQVGVLDCSPRGPVVEGLDRLERLVGLLEQVLREGAVGLLPVPGASGAQPVHHADQVEQPRSGNVVGSVQDLDLDALGAGAVDYRRCQRRGERLGLGVVGQPHDVARSGQVEQHPHRGAGQRLDRVAGRGDRARERCVDGGGEPSRCRGDRRPRRPRQQPRGDPWAGDQQGQLHFWLAGRAVTQLRTGRGWRRPRPSRRRRPTANRSSRPARSWRTCRNAGRPRRRRSSPPRRCAAWCPRRPPAAPLRSGRRSSRARDGRPRSAPAGPRRTRGGCPRSRRVAARAARRSARRLRRPPRRSAPGRAGRPVPRRTAGRARVDQHVERALPGGPAGQLLRCWPCWPAPAWAEHSAIATSSSWLVLMVSDPTTAAAPGCVLHADISSAAATVSRAATGPLRVRGRVTSVLVS